MAVEITIRGKYFVPSTIAGKKELKDYTVKMLYPVSVDQEVPEEVNEAMFFIKRFLLEDAVKGIDPENFYGMQSSECFHVRDLGEEEIKAGIKSGELLAVDVQSLTAEDINNMKRTKDFIKVLILCDTEAEHLRKFNDITDLVARKSTMWAGKDLKSMRAELKSILAIEEVAESKRSNSSRKKSSLMKAAGVESETKSKRTPRKKASE